MVQPWAMLGARDLVTAVQWDTGTRLYWMGHQIDTFSEMSSTINCEHWCDIGGHCDTGHCDDTMLGPGPDQAPWSHCHNNNYNTKLYKYNGHTPPVCFSGFKPPRLVMLGVWVSVFIVLTVSVTDKSNLTLVYIVSLCHWNCLWRYRSWNSRRYHKQQLLSVSSCISVMSSLICGLHLKLCFVWLCDLVTKCWPIFYKCNSSLYLHAAATMENAVLVTMWQTSYGCHLLLSLINYLHCYPTQSYQWYFNSFNSFNTGSTRQQGNLLF